MRNKVSISPDRVFRAFADRTRLRILNLLRAGELCVCDIVETLGLSQPLVSRHLAYLRRAGLVMGRKEGLWIYYRLAEASTAFHKSLINCLGSCFDAVPELARDAKRLKASKRCGAVNGGRCCD